MKHEKFVRPKWKFINPDRFCPTSPDKVCLSNLSSPTHIMNHLPESLRKQVPNAVLRKIDDMDEITQLGFAEEFSKNKKSPLLAFLLVGAGLHYAYLGRVWLTLLFIFTLGGIGIWWFIDIFRVFGMVRERNRSVAIQVLRDIQVLR
jgi:TM2 domain-containing membrane protein YozV